MRLHPLRWTFLGFTVAILGCMAPPTTYGLRSAGDLTPEGELGVGASGSASTGGVMGLGATVDYGLSDRATIAGGLGTLASGFQAELEGRFGSDRERAAGFGVTVGGGVLAYQGAVFVGPHVAVTGRTRVGEGSLYGGLKANQSMPAGGAAAAFQPTLWWGPVVGYAGAPGRLRWGLELVPLIAETTPVDVGLQLWIRTGARPGTGGASG